MKKIVTFSIQYPVTIAMMVLGLLLLGFISYQNLGIDLFPNLNNPKLFVTVEAGERPPEEMERQFIKSIESTAIQQNGAKEVLAECHTGLGIVTVQYNWDKDMDQAFLELQRALSPITQQEEDVELNISQHDPNAVPVMEIGMFHPQNNNLDELRQSAENNVRNRLIRLDGIADLKINGGLEQEVIIQTDPYRLDAYGLTAEEVMTKIQGFNRTLSGGSVEEFGRRYVIKGISLIEDADQLSNIIVGHTQASASPSASEQPSSEQGISNTTTDKVPIKVRDIGQVTVSFKDPENMVLINGQRGLGLSVYKETGYNTVDAVRQLEEALAEVRDVLPQHEFLVIQNHGQFISQAVNEVGESGLLGAFFAIVVLFVFFRRIGVTFIISAAVPISIVNTFNLMYFNDLSINVMTLGGLALGAGMLVDNAIVVIENIFRKMEEGKSVREAAIEGTSEMSGPITASTITTIVVFLPIVYLHGASGELFKDQALTVAFALVSSLVVAVFVIPVLAAKIFKNKQTVKKSHGFKGYDKLLTKILNLKYVITLIAIGLIAATYFIIDQVGSEYMPKVDGKAITVELTLEEGTRLEETFNTVKQVERHLGKLFEGNLDYIYSLTGEEVDDNKPESEGGQHKAYVKLIFNTESEFGASSYIAVLTDYFAELPNIQIAFQQENNALESIVGDTNAPLMVEVEGENPEKLDEVLTQVMQVMEASTEVYGIQSSLENQSPNLEIEVDKYMAGFHGFTSEQVVQQVKEQLMGRDVGKLENSGNTQDIKLKTSSQSIQTLRSMVIKNGDKKIGLEEIAKLTQGEAPASIHRRGQNRIATATAQLNEDKPFSEVVADLEAQFSSINLPAQYSINVTGDESKRKESMSNLTFALVLSIVLVFMVLASQFESLIHPFTILLTIPLAATGGIGLFYILGMPLNIMAYIGLIMLTGIAVNDAIILVDAIIKNKREGMDVKSAIIEAGQKRIRPIIMTSLTTILALLPLVIGTGESVALRAPMALAVIGGLVSSTFLTLMVIPCVFLIFDSWIGKFIPSSKPTMN
ncbi:MAG: efflux RND transporter permease subunit [Bacteroidota bacterium]